MSARLSLSVPVRVSVPLRAPARSSRALDLVRAALAGVLLDVGFPGVSVWPATLLGVAVLMTLLRGRTIRAGAVLGAVTGTVFYLTHVAWTSEYLGPVPWLALSLLEAAFFAVGAGAISGLWSLIERFWPTRLGRLILLPVGVAGVWVGREVVAGSWPYGGFAWGRLAYSQSESPLAPVIAWVGVSGFSFVVVACIVFLLQLQQWLPDRPAVLALAATAVGAALVAVPVWEAVPSGQLRVTAVQGAGPAGYFDARDPGELLDAQINATPRTAGVADVVLWPENSMDEDPLTSPATARRLSELAAELQAPVIVGSITTREGRYYNSSLVWTPDGAAGLYDKKHPVPFGEYVPDRAFWSRLAPDLIGLVQRDYEIGALSPAVAVAGTIAGVSLCFDIVDDRLFDEMIAGGAQVIFAQTNNADFGRTDESAQQLAIARVRAIETGRTIVNVSTVGQSQTILPDGSTGARIPAFTPGAFTDTVPLVAAVTPAMSLRTALAGGITLSVLAPVLTAAVLTLSGIRRPASSRRQRTSGGD
ncbi:apolipoprotein N-acyltransferase [Rathayibacter sp. PhB151]|uniref:apolipoprotein N-acyltransferase n=1 Tax=Rathayibacter sp. PhB151 TaxID=2485189 RepID=UPI00106258FF|nr:apolipoprotein N-acyltransferase [Rathayibacter sp. PhB151]TDX74899.1 apolipoprotein N-acyltransferase [Rathayibacter sp. PhB151]